MYRFPGGFYKYVRISGTHLSFVLPPKEDLFQSKQGTFGSAGMYINRLAGFLKHRQYHYRGTEVQISLWGSPLSLLICHLPGVIHSITHFFGGD